MQRRQQRSKINSMNNTAF